MAWWFSPTLGSQLRTRYLSASWRIARRRNSLRRGSGSCHSSRVLRRSATCASTLPSGCPERGSPQPSPRASTGSTASRSSSSFSGSNAAATPPVLLDPLGDPALVAAGQRDLHAVVANRDELGPVLRHAGTVVDEDQVKVVGRSRTRLLDGLPARLLEHLAIPALVGGPRLL